MKDNSRSEYREHCIFNNDIRLFQQAWWLDATCGEEGWDVVLVRKKDSIVGALTFVKKKKLGFITLSQPPLTQHLGPWIKNISNKFIEKQSSEIEIMTDLISQLPRNHYFKQGFSTDIKNWLPFYWAGYLQSTNYTYILNDINNHKILWDGLRDNIRSDIKKASNRFRLRVRDDLSVNNLMLLVNKTFKRQGLNVPISDEFVTKLDEVCNERVARKIFIAEDEHGRHHAGVYLVWDANRAYYLMGGSDSSLRNSGAVSLCLWEAILFASKVTRSFDFEGSMMKPVEKFFRAFGAEQTPYFIVSNTSSILLQTVFFLRNLKGGR